MADLPAHIAGLLQSDAYPHPVERVELIQTHISFVLLAGDFVYKIKKPLDLGFLNFSTLRQRHYYCRQEVLLNRRLCSDTYIGVVPIVRTAAGYRLGGSGHVIDYAVRMHRLPQEQMMDRLLADNRLNPAMVDQLADKIAAFHAASTSGPGIDRYGSARAIGRNWQENFDQTRPFVGVTLTAWQARYLEEYVRAFMRRNRQLLQERVLAGRVRDCHGDLRASAVCFTDAICVFDCIEFNRRFRYSDVASEIAFLAMDLVHRGHPDLADRFVRRYQRATGDDQLGLVLSFYACYRAYVRGKVNSFQLDEPEIPEEAKAISRTSARRYFELACRFASDDRPPLLMITCGLSGTGKTAVAHALADRLDLAVVSSDVVRKELVGLAATERQHERYGGGIYSARVTQQTYAAMLRRARELLNDSQSVILDATFLRRELRARAAGLASDAGAYFFCVETLADAAVVQQRLAGRELETAAISDARWDTYLMQQQVHEPAIELDRWQLISIDSGRARDEVVADALSALQARLDPSPMSRMTT